MIATGDASTVGNPICVTCGNEEGYTDHFRPAPNYHKFESSLKKPKKAAPIHLPDDPEKFDPASIQ